MDFDNGFRTQANNWLPNILVDSRGRTTCPVRGPPVYQNYGREGRNSGNPSRDDVQEWNSCTTKPFLPAFKCLIIVSTWIKRRRIETWLLYSQSSYDSTICRVSGGG